MNPLNPHNRFNSSLLLCAAITLSVAQLAQAGGLMKDGLGAISIGRGGTNIAFADNGQVMLDNPAGLANMRVNQMFDLSVDFLFTEIKYSDPLNPTTSDIDNPFPAGHLSFAKRLNDRWTAGFGFFSQGGFAAEYELQGQAPFTGTQHQKSLGALLRVLPTLAYNVNDRLSIGGTFGVAASHLEIEGPYVFQGPSPFAGVPARVDVQGTGAAISWGLGLQYDLTERTTLGVAYQAETDFTFRGSTKADIAGLGRGYYDSKIESSWPSSLGIGLKHDICDCRTVAVDVVWFDWSHAFDSLDLDLTNGTGPVAGVTGPALPESFPLNWRDAVEVRLGYQKALDHGRIIRTGYVFHRNPIPDATLTPYIPSTYVQTVSAGYGRRFKSCQVDFAYSYSWDDDPAVVTSGFIGGDYDNSQISTDVHWFSVSIQKIR